jgi:hypothetical protein
MGQRLEDQKWAAFTLHPPALRLFGNMHGVGFLAMEPEHEHLQFRDVDFLQKHRILEVAGKLRSHVLRMHKGSRVNRLLEAAGTRPC